MSRTTSLATASPCAAAWYTVAAVMRAGTPPAIAGSPVIVGAASTTGVPASGVDDVVVLGVGEGVPASCSP